MTKKNNLKTLMAHLSALGVSASLTKSRLEMLKALAPPAQPNETPSTEPNCCNS